MQLKEAVMNFFFLAPCHWRHRSSVYQSNNGDDDGQEGEIYTNQPLPPLAWLLSFPNSGTSYTMAMVKQILT